MVHKKDFVKIAVRLLGLYMIAQILATIPGALVWWSASSKMDYFGRIGIYSSLINIGVFLFGGLILWMISGRLSDAICRDISAEPLSIGNFDLEQIQTIAVSIIGLYIVCSATPALVTLVVNYIFPNTSPYEQIVKRGRVVTNIPVAEYISVIVRLVIGMFLLLGSKGIVNVIRSFWKKAKLDEDLSDESGS